MATAETTPVEDTVAKVGNELAVGEDLEFQRKWWRFEKIAWAFFVTIVLLDVAGVFGRGPAAKAHRASREGLMNVNYERIERFSTPSILTVHFSTAAVEDGKIHLWVSDSMITKLGNQRVIPQPTVSQTGNGGIFYTFSATPLPNAVEFALEPSSPGLSEVQMRIVSAANESDPGAQPPRDVWSAKIFTMP